jgi:hypothetical protein
LDSEKTKCKIKFSLTILLGPQEELTEVVTLEATPRLQRRKTTTTLINSNGNKSHTTAKVNLNTDKSERVWE